MTSPMRKVFALLLALAVGLSVYYFAARSPGDQQQGIARPAASGPAENRRPPETAVAPTPALPTGDSSHANLAGPAANSKSQRFREWSRSGSPEDALRAYTLARACLQARGVEQAVNLQPLATRDEETKAALANGDFTARANEACGDLTAQELAMRDRLIEQAAAAGVPMAAVLLTSEGPFGDPSALTSRPEDPAVIEWRKRMVDLLELAAAKADYNAMASLSSMYRDGSGVIGQRDPVKALEYNVAMWDLHKSASGLTSPAADSSIAGLSKALPHAQASKAIADGHQRAQSILAAGGKQ